MEVGEKNNLDLRRGNAYSGSQLFVDTGSLWLVALVVPSIGSRRIAHPRVDEYFFVTVRDIPGCRRYVHLLSDSFSKGAVGPLIYRNGPRIQWINFVPQVNRSVSDLHA